MSDDDLDQALLLQGRITAFVRAFGLHQPDRTPCGTPVPTSEAHAVGELDRDGPLTQGELGRRLRLEKSTVSRLVSILEQREWLTRSRSQHDGRAVTLRLTEEGQRIADQLAAARRAKFVRIVDAVPADQRPAVLAALATLVEALDADA
jgi:DNA-binding MarR family transcriptional regulator